MIADHTLRHAASVDKLSASLAPSLPAPLRRASQLSAEVEQGNREYKYKLTNLTQDQLRHRISQLAWRLNESVADVDDSTSHGKSADGVQTAVYQIGVDDDGTPVGLTRPELEESLRNLSAMAEVVGCSLTVSHVLIGVGRQSKGGVGRGVGSEEDFLDESEERLVAEVVFKKIEREAIGNAYLQIAVIGAMGSGKSTMIGVMLSGKHDNGKGLARTHVFRHNHEVQTGTTSSVSDHVIFFGADGSILNQASEKTPGARIRSKSDLECADDACRVASFIDLAGHPKYLKTTLQGICARSPALCLLCVSAEPSANALAPMLIEHLAMALALNLRLAVVITKTDLVSDQSKQSIAVLLQRVLALQGKMGLFVSSVEQIIQQIYPSLSDPAKPHPSTIVPIFQVSFVTGEGIELLQSFIFQIPISPPLPPSSPATETLCSLERQTSGELIDLQTYPTEVRVVGSFPCALSSQLSSNDTCPSPQDPVSVSVIDGLVHADTVFLVVIQRGVLSVGDVLYVGPSSTPTPSGSFFERIRVTSVRVSDIAVRSVVRGQCATIRVEVVYPLLASSSLSESSGDTEVHVRKTPVGLVMLSCYPKPLAYEGFQMLPLPLPKAVWEFNARVVIVNGKVRVAYESVLHVDNVRQTVSVVSVTSPVYSKKTGAKDSSEDVELGNGDRALCRFRFLFRPEYVQVGASLLLRDGRIRGIGNIVDID